MNILRCDMTQYEWVVSHSWRYSGVTWLIHIESCHTHEVIEVWHDSFTVSHATLINILRCDMIQYEWVMSHSWTYSGVTWLIHIESCHTHEHIQVWLCPYVWHASIWICHVILMSHVTLIFRHEESYHTHEHSRHGELCHTLEHNAINKSWMSHITRMNITRMNTFRYDYVRKCDMPQYE